MNINSEPEGISSCSKSKHRLLLNSQLKIEMCNNELQNLNTIGN